jgi:hypothetical protein
MNSVKNANAPQTKAPGMCMMFRKIVTRVPLMKPPIRFDLIHALTITDILENAMVALSRCAGGNINRYNSISGRGLDTM